MKTLLFFLLATLPCYANIGETPEQSIKRYGTPVHFKDESLNVAFSKWASFDRPPFQIIASFYKDKCVNLSFTKMDVNPDGTMGTNEQPLSDEEIKVLLEENSDGKTWGQPTTNSYSYFTVWTRSDGVTASYSHDSTPSLMFEADKNKKQDSSAAAAKP